MPSRAPEHVTKAYLRRAAAGLVLAIAAAALAGPARAGEADDVARFLAGLEPGAGSPLTALTAGPAWQRHAADMNDAWRGVEQRRLGEIRAWSARTLAKRRRTMFYMFGGPDFAHADAFFSDASVFVQSGLEPVGPMPRPADLAAPSLAAALVALRGSFSNFRQFGYFITSEMREQFQAGIFTGTLPILYVTLARLGKTIRQVDFVTLGRNGAIVAVPGDSTPAVRITYADRRGTEKTLYYFQTNLSNAGVAQSGFLQFCARLGEGVSLVKSASYLLHRQEFSAVRDFLLQHSAMLVQDDSGIPFRHFDQALWRLRPFGRYLGPIEIFADAYQDDLARFFKSARPRPIRFGIGYRWHPKRTNVLVAEKR